VNNTLTASMKAEKVPVSCTDSVVLGSLFEKRVHLFLGLLDLLADGSGDGCHLFRRSFLRSYLRGLKQAEHKVREIVISA
jgi:hypothetical protein